MSKRIFHGDYVLWIVFLIFVLISIVEVFSAASTLSYKSGDFMKPIYGHIGHLLMGFVLMLIVHRIPSRWFKVASLVLPVSWLLLVGVLLLTSFVNGAMRWLLATELCKICTVISIALILSRTQEEKSAHPAAFRYILSVLAVSCCLIGPENLSTAMILIITVILMMIVGRVPKRQVGMVAGVIGIAAISFVVLAKITPPSVMNWMSEQPGIHRVPTMMSRVNNFGSDEEKEWDVYGKDAQRIYANAAIQHGGFTGIGIGNSSFREYLPQAYSDFIYAIIIEESGMFGASLVVLLYVIVLVRSYRISRKSPYLFTSLMVMGLVTMLFIQALINMFVAVGIMPVTGQPLPFLSRGGWSIISSCVVLGIIISASRERVKEENKTGKAGRDNVTRDT
ncbi:MAG: FtsW/RodA/SpoVE family cell cycle protein [Bacteroidaceae bacterium]|nr:FtsW/RodA/SpoVE family cell cycle protein [Bacteroidaceae bacterium]